MHILAINGSMRKNRTTTRLLTDVLGHIRALYPQATFDVLDIADQDVRPCRVTCSSFCSHHEHVCSIDDDVNTILKRMIQADALLLGAPQYFRAPPAHFHAFAERLVSMFYYKEATSPAVSPLRGKPCGLVAVAEYSNPHQILEYLHDFALLLGLAPVHLERFPYLGVAGQGELRPDDTFQVFARSADLAQGILAQWPNPQTE